MQNTNILKVSNNKLTPSPPNSTIPPSKFTAPILRILAKSVVGS